MVRELRLPGAIYDLASQCLSLSYHPRRPQSMGGLVRNRWTISALFFFYFMVSNGYNELSVARRLSGSVGTPWEILIKFCWRVIEAGNC